MIVKAFDSVSISGVCNTFLSGSSLELSCVTLILVQSKWFVYLKFIIFN